ncbi:MAG TPA: hypothetical protein VK203_10330 [Nostocaceae cyanobacterium]|nr:hypothetical protein [Nostocaceae cyanobacterium]
MQTKNYYLIMALLVISTLSVSCNSISSNIDNQTISLANQTPANLASDSLKSSEFSKIEQSYRDFDNSLTDLLSELQKASDKKVNQAKINTNNFNLKVKQLITVNNDLLLRTQTPRLIRIHNEIDVLLKEIQKIIQPLNRGLTIKNVAKLQKLLALTDLPAVRRNLGSYGTVTHTAVKKRLINLNDSLRDTIQQLDIREPISIFSNVPESDIQISQARNQQIQEQKAFSTFVTFFTGVLTALLLVWMVYLYQKFRKSHTKQANYFTPNSNSRMDISQTTILQNSTVLNDIPQETILQKSTVLNEKTFLQNRTPTNLEAVTSTSSNNVKLSQQESEKQEIGNNYTNLHLVEVAETEKSINQRRCGMTTEVIVEKVLKGKGNYFIINEEGIYYLIPKPNLKITEYNYQNIEIFFKLNGYQPANSTDFKVAKRAQVAVFDQNQWLLIEFGILQF